MKIFHKIRAWVRIRQFKKHIKKKAWLVHFKWLTIKEIKQKYNQPRE